jgi:hypothetical protein
MTGSLEYRGQHSAGGRLSIRAGDLGNHNAPLPDTTKGQPPDRSGNRSFQPVKGNLNGNGKLEGHDLQPYTKGSNQ